MKKIMSIYLVSFWTQTYVLLFKKFVLSKICNKSKSYNSIIHEFHKSTRCVFCRHVYNHMAMIWNELLSKIIMSFQKSIFACKSLNHINYSKQKKISKNQKCKRESRSFRTRKFSCLNPNWCSTMIILFSLQKWNKLLYCLLLYRNLNNKICNVEKNWTSFTIFL